MTPVASALFSEAQKIFASSFDRNVTEPLLTRSGPVTEMTLIIHAISRSNRIEITSQKNAAGGMNPTRHN